MIWQLGYSVSSMKPDNMTHLQAGMEKELIFKLLVSQVAIVIVL